VHIPVDCTGDLVGTSVVGEPVVATVVGSSVGDLVGWGVGADVTGADVVGADVDGAKDVGEELVGAAVMGTDDVGADVMGADVVGADVDSAASVGKNGKVDASVSVMLGSDPVETLATGDSVGYPDSLVSCSQQSEASSVL